MVSAACWQPMLLSLPGADFQPLVRRARPLLGTFVEIALPEQAARHFEAGFAAISHVHDCMSFHMPDSDLSRVNSADAGTIVDVDRHLVRVLRCAELLRARTAGLFDVTVGRVLVKEGFLPRLSDTNLAHVSGAAEAIVIVDDTHVCCTQRVLIDLGGIAKGYAVDLAVQALVDAGVDCGVVNAGGDLRVFGSQDHTIHIRDGLGRIIDQIVLNDCAIATSSNFANRSKRRGRVRTPHIGPNGQAVLIDGTISVIAETCMCADAMTKIAMTNPDLADSLLAECGGRVIRKTHEVIAD